MAATLDRRLILLLAGVSALGSLAIHMFVPALPSIAGEMASNPGTVQLTISLYLLGLGGGQLAAGPISDAIGRRPVLLAGIAIFVTASAFAAAAQTVEMLLLARLIEAAGAAACLISARAMISDLSAREDTPANLAALTSAVLLSPTIAPTIGGALVSLAGWRSVFVVLALSGLAMGVAAAWLVPRRSPPGQPPHLLRSYARLARNARFRGYVAGNSLATSALFMFLSGSPFLLIGQYHLTPAQAGLCYVFVAGMAIVGTFLVRLMRGQDAFRIGLILVASGGAAMLATALLGGNGPVALIAPMLMVGLGCGIVSPTGAAGAMHAEEGIAGTATSLAGAIQMIVSAGVTAMMIAIGSASLTPLAIAIFAAGLAATILAPRERSIR
ncbi:Bcr/CflA family efflux MFS transporter [Sphingomonas soli]|uniref:Bcr/CflA family efflux MFS transporter n=1 Tax=Sphingomonas soli TaxID=266127 RepID=UPI00082A2624|nr:Bcr/CflA family efflux MFS transporter [Sphingomonas soli]